jgi:hypothetical protein
MKKVSIDLQYCYGIKSLATTLDFSTESAQAVYAPNGVMKSSFAQTFHDLSHGAISRDRIFSDRVCVREVRDENGKEIPPESVFVVRPYDQDFAHSEKTSILLVDSALRKEYEQLQAGIEKQKGMLLAALKKHSKSKKDLEAEVSSAFTSSEQEFETALTRIQAELTEMHDAVFVITKNERGGVIRDMRDRHCCETKPDRMTVNRMKVEDSGTMPTVRSQSVKSMELSPESRIRTLERATSLAPRPKGCELNSSQPPAAIHAGCWPHQTVGVKTDDPGEQGAKRKRCILARPVCRWGGATVPRQPSSAFCDKVASRERSPECWPAKLYASPEQLYFYPSLPHQSRRNRPLVAAPRLRWGLTD